MRTSIRGISNKQVRLAARPAGLPKESDWALTVESVAEPGANEVLIRVKYLSIDPAMRGWMNDRDSYIEPVAIGEVMRAGGCGEVVASANPLFAVGDPVTGLLGVQEYATLNGEQLTKIDLSVAPSTVHLGALGPAGMTAYFGLLEVGSLKEGNTVLISGAAGAVGSIAGQIAKIKGCRAVGIAGGPEKARHVVEDLGFDACIDYKSGDVSTSISGHCPAGVDVYFDNVGGEILDAALGNLALHARVVICGAISQYNATAERRGPSNYYSLLHRRASMTGFVVFDFAARYPEAARDIARWRGEGRLNTREDIVTGDVADFPRALLRLFRGDNVGKLLLKLGS